jgi:predicted nucleic acid-binding protein
VKRAVIADTGPLFAAVDPDDAHHQRAVREIEKLAREKIEVIIAYPTLMEAYTLVLYRLGAKTAFAWLNEMEHATLLNPTSEDFRQAFLRTQALPDQTISLFDATLAALSKRLNVPVWTYDHHFDLLRAPIWR